MKSVKWIAISLVALSAQAFAANKYVPGEVLVKYRADAIRTRDVMNTFYNDLGVDSVSRMKGSMAGLEKLRFSTDSEVQDMVAKLNQDPMVEYAQPNYILSIYPIEEERGLANVNAPIGAAGGCWIPGIPFPPGCDDGGGGGGGGGNDSRPALKEAPAEVIPAVADPNLSQAYGISKISAPNAWKVNRGSKSVLVAVIDTGIDYNHEDLAFNVWRNAKPTKSDIVGFDFVHNDGLPFDDNKHGTHTSGTVGATGGNGIGVSGVNQQVSIMGVKFLDGQGSGSTENAIKAIDYAVTHGAKILSNSWGGGGSNQALLDSIKRARDANVLFVAAAGNDGSNNDSKGSYPASYDVENMIAVAATDSNDAMASFSNYGVKTTHLAAPGVKVYSTTPGNKYEAFSGTSMACPHVAGAAALVLAQNPTFNYKQIKEALLNTVDKVSALSGKVSTGGRLNVEKAIAYKPAR